MCIRDSRNTIEQETIAQINKDAEKTVKALSGKDYKKMKMRDFIKAFDAMTDALIKLKMVD